jgi:hypothetical protein
MYLSRLNNGQLNPLLYGAYNLTIILDTQSTYTWHTFRNIDVKLTDECKTIKETNTQKHQGIKGNVEYVKV